MSLQTTIKFITNHPLNAHNKIRAIFRFIQWQARLRLSQKPILFPFTDRCKLLVERGMTGATGNLYCGLHEYVDMLFLLHFLRREDLFVDIGANIGSYTILASGHVGALTISVEPVPTTFVKLVRNISVNNLQDRVEPLNMALGSEKDKLNFTTSLDTVNHVATSHEENTISVDVDTLESVLKGRIPALIKIDVEGFETEVLKGADNVLKDPSLRAIIIELNGSGDRYGYDEIKIHDKFIGHGFVPCIYDPSARTLKKVDHFGVHNTIYIKDVNFAAGRVRTADGIRILDQVI